MSERYWLFSQVGSFKIRTEVSRDAYKTAYAAAFPDESGAPDFDPPIDPHWWRGGSIGRPIYGYTPEGKWALLRHSTSLVRGGYVDQDWGDE